MPTEEQLNQIFKEELQSNKIYPLVLDIVEKNKRGKIWLIGSRIYKTLAQKLYGCSSPSKDWDFVVEGLAKPLLLPNGWEIEENKHGNPELRHGSVILHLIPLDNIHSIIVRNLEPSIEDYLSGVPLTIQSIAFDVGAGKLIGETGIRSILEKTIGVNNQKEYEYALGIYGDNISVKEYAKMFGFTEAEYK